MATRNKAPDHVVRRLRALKMRVQFGNAQFGMNGETVTCRDFAGEVRTLSYDDFIKQETEPYRNDTLYLVEELLKWANGERVDIRFRE